MGRSGFGLSRSHFRWLPRPNVTAWRGRFQPHCLSLTLWGLLSSESPGWRDKGRGRLGSTRLGCLVRNRMGFQRVVGGFRAWASWLGSSGHSFFLSRQSFYGSVLWASAQLLLTAGPKKNCPSQQVSAFSTRTHLAPNQITQWHSVPKHALV